MIDKAKLATDAARKIEQAIGSELDVTTCLEIAQIVRETIKLATAEAELQIRELESKQPKTSRA